MRSQIQLRAVIRAPRSRCSKRCARPGSRIIYRSICYSSARAFKNDVDGAQASPARISPEKLAKQAGLTSSTNSGAAATSRTRKSIVVTEVEASHTGNIKIIFLNETASMNALSRNMVNELSDEIGTIDNETVPARTQALIIASESEKAFCAGANLKERAAMTIEEANAFLSQLRSTLTRISELPVPVIAAVNGNALGGGLELAMSAHLRVFSPSAIVGQPEVRLGIIPGAGGTYRLPALVGLSRAREMMLTARRINGKEAYDYGLCHLLSKDVGNDKLEDKNQVLVSALQLATEITSGAPLAIRAIIQATRNGGSPSDEKAAYEDVIRTRDRDEALAAFREKRAPVFVGQ